MATNKYDDIEIQTAENLLKRGFKWITRGIYGAIIAYKIKPDQEKYISGNVICSDLVPIFESIGCGDDPVSLEAIVHPPILDDAERKYLAAVIKPFRSRVKFLKKYKGDLNFGPKYECIYGQVRSEFNKDLIFSFDLPAFKEGTMYKGMKPDHEYTLDELGL